MTPLTFPQQAIVILLCAAATMLPRFLPFAVFSGKRKTPRIVRYLGAALPGAIFGMLVIYCLRNVSWLSGSRGAPELIAIAIVVALHLWKRQTLLSIAAGTICYMFLVQVVFALKAHTVGCQGETVGHRLFKVSYQFFQNPFIPFPYSARILILVKRKSEPSPEFAVRCIFFTAPFAYARSSRNRGRRSWQRPDNQQRRSIWAGFT